ncbi:hypothetical protein VZC37_21435 [Gordonia sp. LSe1-13]|uniref:Anti-sigma factor n=1 Tax=Gordonia sesuvii TaxID=3116777 RepID=A0ABU7MIJ9_9ACTN|nr:hypothetical protein [Gordonia sp. LSe1-13]
MEVPYDTSVEITVSAAAERVSTVRHVVRDVLSDIGVESDCTTDLILAVDAMCGLVVACSAESQPLRCAVTVHRDATSACVTGRLVDGLPLPVDGYAWRLLDGTVEDVAVDARDDGWVMITCRKPHAPSS